MTNKINFHPHALQRMNEREVEKFEVTETVLSGENIPAKYDRVGFRKNFLFGKERKNKLYNNKQIEVYGVFEDDAFLVLTVIARYF